MKRVLVFALLAAGLASGSSAVALERESTTRITLANGVVVSSSKGTFDPETGAFSRDGMTVLPNGSSFYFTVSGTCQMADLLCDFSGTAKGPMGGKWVFEGDVIQSAGKTSLNSDLTAPNGRQFRIEHESSGDAPRLADFLQF
jgi:ABC-type transport system substrate-binding protein